MIVQEKIDGVQQLHLEPQLGTICFSVLSLLHTIGIFIPWSSHSDLDKRTRHYIPHSWWGRFEWRGKAPGKDQCRCLTADSFFPKGLFWKEILRFQNPGEVRRHQWTFLNFQAQKGPWMLWSFEIIPALAAEAKRKHRRPDHGSPNFCPWLI